MRGADLARRGRRAARRSRTSSPSYSTAPASRGVPHRAHRLDRLAQPRAPGARPARPASRCASAACRCRARARTARPTSRRGRARSPRSAAASGRTPRRSRAELDPLGLERGRRRAPARRSGCGTPAPRPSRSRPASARRASSTFSRCVGSSSSRPSRIGGVAYSAAYVLRRTMAERMNAVDVGSSPSPGPRAYSSEAACAAARTARRRTAARGVLPVHVRGPRAAVDSGRAVDRKPQARSGREPARVRFLREQPDAALTVDRYDDDWSGWPGSRCSGGRAVLRSRRAQPRAARRARRRSTPPVRATSRRPGRCCACSAPERCSAGLRATDRVIAVRIGVSLPNVGLDHGKEMVLPVAEAAERLGFDSVWAAHHVVLPYERASKYPYQHSGPRSRCRPGCSGSTRS